MPHPKMRQSQDETKCRFVSGMPKHLLTNWIQERYCSKTGRGGDLAASRGCLKGSARPLIQSITTSFAISYKA